MGQELRIGMRERWLDLKEMIELRPDPSGWVYGLPVAAFGGTFFAVPADVRPLLWILSLALLVVLAGIVALFVAAWLLDGAVAYAVSRSMKARSSQAREGSATLHACQGHPAGR